MNAQETIALFLRGDMDIISFRRLYDEQPEINDYLQGIVDDARIRGVTKFRRFQYAPFGEMVESDSGISHLLNPRAYPGVRYGNSPYDSVRKMLTYEFRMITHDARSASGASKFYGELYALYYQVDQSIPYDYKYSKAYDFALDVIPQYLSGGEAKAYYFRDESDGSVITVEQFY